jgi:hypothetical protein
MRLFRHLGGDLPLEQRRRSFARFAGFFLLLLAGGFALTAAMILIELHSGKALVIQGKIVARTSLLVDLVFFIVASIATSLLAWYWYRVRVRRLYRSDT